MGSPEGEAGRRSDEGPRRQVTIARPFAVGKYEVTFAEWEACVAGGGCQSNRSPSDQGWGRGRRPVMNVSWNDAREYVAWLSRKSGKTYRLLSEAEWEYAARSGKGSFRYWWGGEASHEHINYGTESCCKGLAQGRDQWVNTAPVGEFPANPFGLHDMHGNVGEWVEDCWHDSYSGAPSDGSAWTSGCTMAIRRVVRGGTWLSDPPTLRSAHRFDYLVNDRFNFEGFRVARRLGP
jgi:formylglycine-generating enzyme required for sulfatase activity